MNICVYFGKLVTTLKRTKIDAVVCMPDASSETRA